MLVLTHLRAGFSHLARLTDQIRHRISDLFQNAYFWKMRKPTQFTLP
jgi:hypothetical protein